jgi:hypothetical protein
MNIAVITLLVVGLLLLGFKLFLDYNIFEFLVASGGLR